MLKTRLAEKDAQLMGGFGALSNMQLGGAQGWLGGLPDPEFIAATLADQTRPYIHPHSHPSPARKSAWGSKHGGDRLSIGRTSSTKGTLGLPQQLPAIVPSADAQSKSTISMGISGWQSPQDPPAPGLNAASPRALQQPQGRLQKPSQARPVLLPLSASQNGMLLSPAVHSSIVSSRDSFQDDSVDPAEVSAAASAAAVPVTNAGALSTEGLRPSVAAVDSAESDQNSEMGSESEFSETDSEASGAAEAATGQVSGNAALGSTVRTNQTAALQQPPGDRDTSSLTSDSVPAAQDSRDRFADESQQSLDVGGAGGGIANSKTNKKWHIW